MDSIPVKDLIAFIKGYIDSEYSIKINEVVKIKYPEYAYQIVNLSFVKRLSRDEFNKALPIIEYWGSTPYVGGIKNLYPYGYSPKITFFCDENNSSSSNPRKHKPLEQLADWLQNGTPMRSTMNNTRAHEGLGNILLEVEAV